MTILHDLIIHCAAIGQGEPPAAKRVIDRPGLIAMPGLIDAHSLAGHGLVRAAGDAEGDLWFRICKEMYAGVATPGFWRAVARLAQIERLLSGVTTAVSLLGGGENGGANVGHGSGGMSLLRAT